MAIPPDPASTAAPRRRWTVGDVIDFEQLVQRDDVAIGPPGFAPADGEDRSTVFLRWLDARRHDGEAVLPGTTYERGRRVVQAIVGFAGLVVGAGLAGSLLSHRDAEPINALLFFGATVGLQVLVLVAVMLAWLLRRVNVRCPAIDDAMLLFVRAAGRVVDRLDGSRRSSLRARWAALDLRSDRLSPLVGSQMLGVTQRFAIAFNGGLIVAMLFVWLPFTDLRFGWQSTYPIDPGTVDAGVRAVAAPWRWMAADLAPDAAQIAATRYTRGQRAESLPSDAARAWWPFLFCAIVVYGLLLRVALTTMIGATLRRRLDRLTFTHPAANALWRRLHGPLVTAHANDVRLTDGPQVTASSTAARIALLIVDTDLAPVAERVRSRLAAWAGAAMPIGIAADVDDDRPRCAARRCAGDAPGRRRHRDRRRSRSAAGRGRRPARDRGRGRSVVRPRGAADGRRTRRDRRAPRDLAALRRDPSTRGARGGVRVTPDVPTFAVVGAVNHGKSSVVAALAEDDEVRVSAMPGETVATQRFGLRDLLVFFDTPGFQNARKALAAIDALDASGDPLDVFRRFIERFRDDAAFDAECRLLRPVVDGAGLIYVVDGSRPLRDINLCEMEILRRTGAPRLAIVNRTIAVDRSDDHADAWIGRLNQHFNLVRAFDAHRATYDDRRDLLEALASIERGWKDRLGRAVALLDADRHERIVDAAARIADLVTACVGHAERARVDAASDAPARDRQVATLRRRYMDAVSTIERDGHRRLIALYAHRRVEPEALPDSVVGGDLFGEETWRLFGLGMRQLVGVSTVAGGLTGAGIDAATLGHSFGLGAALGAVAGAGGAWAVGKRRPEIAVDWPAPGFVRRVLPGQALRFAGGDVTVGPYRAENFPWILLDRALCTVAYVMTRSHARRDAAVPDVQTLLSLLATMALGVADWTDGDRATGQRVFARIRKGDRPAPEAVVAFREAIERALHRIATHERAIGDGLQAVA